MLFSQLITVGLSYLPENKKTLTVFLMHPFFKLFFKKMGENVQKNVRLPEGDNWGSVRMWC